MTIVFFSNYINHHQVHFADELYKLTSGNFYFVETMKLPEFRQKLGYSDFSDRPYLIQTWKSDCNIKKAEELCKNADVALFGGGDILKYQINRAKEKKISFEISERWFKKGIINILSPNLIKNIVAYHTIFKYSPMYKLCCSAYTAGDQYKLGSYKNRCYKWGYFTSVPEGVEVETRNQGVSTSKTTPHLMWCGRFLRWKHPELPVKMAALLKEKGYKFKLDMYGSGSEEGAIRQLIQQLHVDDIVKTHGAKSNEEILHAMRQHDIFLFTSDKNEGWGAVANEAMGNGCVLVGSNEIGSIPFLIKDGENGFIFKSKDVESLTKKVEWLINHPEDRAKFAQNGYKTIKEIWSPYNAAKNLIQLINDIKSGKDTSITEGPCSKALPI